MIGLIYVYILSIMVLIGFGLCLTGAVLTIAKGFMTSLGHRLYRTGLVLFLASLIGFISYGIGIFVKDTLFLILN
jgi:hypothetical protein